MKSEVPKGNLALSCVENPSVTLALGPPYCSSPSYPSRATQVPVHVDDPPACGAVLSAHEQHRVDNDFDEVDVGAGEGDRGATQPKAVARMTLEDVGLAVYAFNFWEEVAEGSRRHANEYSTS